MSLHTLYYPSHVLGNLNTQRTLYKARINPVLAVPPYSVILQTDESDNKPDSKKISGSVSINSRNFLLTQHYIVGIMGGISADSTLNFVKKLVKLNSKGEADGLPFVLCSDPALNKDLLSHERNSFSFTRKDIRTRPDSNCGKSDAQKDFSRAFWGSLYCNALSYITFMAR